MVRLNKLTTEQRNEATANLDKMSSLQIAQVMNKEDSMLADVVRDLLPEIAEAIDWASEALGKEGRMIFLGAGTSGRLGLLDAVECVPTFGVSPEKVIGLIAGGDRAFVKAVEGAEDSTALAEEELKELSLSADDLIIGLAASGRTPYVIYGLKFAKKIGCRTIAIACNKDSEIGRQADLAIEAVSGPEVLTGSTRLKAGTVQKMILNMISTGAMVKIGKVYQNLMVDVIQTNEKLVSRAENIVIEATGCSQEEAQKYISLADGKVKLAIVMILLNCSRKTAESALHDARGHISQALEENIRYEVYSDDQAETVCRLWNEVCPEINYRPFDSKKSFIEEVASNINFKPEGCFIAYEGSVPVGFAIAVSQEEYLQNQTFDNTPGYILMLAVKQRYRNHGIGSELLSLCEDFLHVLGKKAICFSHKCPIKLSWYVDDQKHEHNKAPGVKQDSFGYTFLAGRGYEVSSEEVSYYLDLKDFHIPEDIAQQILQAEEKGFSVTFFDASKHYGYRDMFQNLKDPSFLKKFENGIKTGQDLLIVADKNNRVCGSAGTVFPEPNGRGFFSALAVDPAYGGQGLGNVLFFSLCRTLKKLGAEYMTIFVAKTNFARKIYDKAGFKAVQNWAILRKGNIDG